MKRAHIHSRDGNNSVKQARKEERCTRPRLGDGGKYQDSIQQSQQQLERTSRLDQKKMNTNTQNEGCKEVETSKRASKERRSCPKILFRKHFFRLTKSLLKYLKGVKIALYKHAMRIIKEYQEIHGLVEVAILQKIELSLRTLVGPTHWQIVKREMQQCDGETCEGNADEYNLLDEEINDEDSIAPVNDDETNAKEVPIRESSSTGESHQSEAEENVDQSVRAVRDASSNSFSGAAQNNSRSSSREILPSEVLVVKHGGDLSKPVQSGGTIRDVLARARSPESYVEELSYVFCVFKKQDEQYHIADYLSDDYQENLEADANPNLNFPSADSTSTASSCTGINEIWRDKICEWCYQVVDHFDYNRQVVAIALNFLDRYLSKKAVNRTIFQLASMTSLFLAIKLNEQKSLSLNAFLNLSRGYFKGEEVLEMEQIMLRVLDWRMHPPIALVQSKHLMFCVPCNLPRRPDIMEITLFMTEISVCDYFFVSKKESTVALAAILSAFDVIGPTVVREEDRVIFVDTVRRLTGLESYTPEVYACMDRLKKSFQHSGFTLSI